MFSMNAVYNDMNNDISTLRTVSFDLPRQVGTCIGVYGGV